MSFLENLELLAIKTMLEESAKECERQTRENLEKFGIMATFNIELKVEGVDLDTFHKYADNTGNNDIWGQLGLK